MPHTSHFCPTWTSHKRNQQSSAPWGIFCSFIGQSATENRLKQNQTGFLDTNMQKQRLKFYELQFTFKG